MNIYFVICILVFSLYVYNELRERAPFLGNSILVSYISRSYDKTFEKSTNNICSVVYILVFPPLIYWAFSRELQRRASILGKGIWSPYPFNGYDKKNSNLYG